MRQDYSKSDKSIVELLAELEPKEQVASEAKQLGTSEEAGETWNHQFVSDVPVIRIINSILVDAIRDNASEVHIGPTGSRVVIRYVINGVTSEQEKLARWMWSLLVQRIKILGDMNPAECHKPQESNIRIKIKKKEYDLNIQIQPAQLTYPTEPCERAVIRIAAR